MIYRILENYVGVLIGFFVGFSFWLKFGSVVSEGVVASVILGLLTLSIVYQLLFEDVSK